MTSRRAPAARDWPRTPAGALHLLLAATACKAGLHSRGTNLKYDSGRRSRLCRHCQTVAGRDMYVNRWDHR